MKSVTEFEAIGTNWYIEFEHELGNEAYEALLAKVHATIDAFDKDYSRFRPDSLVTEISKAAGTYILPDTAVPMMQLYQKLYAMTDGAFTPLIGRTMEEAGYDASYSLEEKQLSKLPELPDVVSYEPPQLTTKMPVLLDFGAAGKGHLVDLVANILKDSGVEEYLIDAGGDIALSFPEDSPARIGLEHPNDFSKVIGVATIAKNSICGSSGNRRAWGSFHHIINPKTLTSPREILATWVVADRTILADALATCLYFVPAVKLLDAFPFEYLIVRQDLSIEKSANFPGEIFA